MSFLSERFPWRIKQVQTGVDDLTNPFRHGSALEVRRRFRSQTPLLGLFGFRVWAEGRLAPGGVTGPGAADRSAASATTGGGHRGSFHTAAHLGTAAERGLRSGLPRLGVAYFRVAHFPERWVALATPQPHFGWMAL